MDVCQVLLLGLIFAVLVLKSKETSLDKWKCYEPENRTLEGLMNVSGHMKTAMSVVDHAEWMLDPLQYISCFKRGLTSVPQGLSNDIAALNLGFNAIRKIRTNDFMPYKSLVALWIHANCIFFNYYDASMPLCTTDLLIESGAFKTLSKLKYLNIDANSIKQLPDMLPKSLMVLSSCQTTIGPIFADKVFQESQLEIVLLGNNCFVSDLEHLCAGNFTILGPVFSHVNLKHLDISENNWNKIPKYLFTSSLQGIDIWKNPITIIEKDDFLTVKNLKYLDVSFTSYFSKTPLAIEDGAFDALVELNTLDLRVNMLSNISTSLFKYNKKLKYLDLSFNCIKSLATDPTFLPPMPFLETLILSGNTFCDKSKFPVKPRVERLQLSDYFLQFPNLTSLYLGTDGITSYMSLYLTYGTDYSSVDNSSLSVLKKLSNLKSLILGACGIRKIDFSTFNNLTLEKIDLRVNQIGEAPYHYTSTQKVHAQRNDKFVMSKSGEMASEKMLSLSTKMNTNDASSQSLSLCFNAINDLSDYSFKFLPFLTSLDLSKNNINYIYNNTFSHLTRLETIDLRYNPIRFIELGALEKLSCLTNLWANVTAHQNQFRLDFLKRAKSDISLRLWTGDDTLYSLIKEYQDPVVYFERVVSIDFAGNTIPNDLLVSNQPIFKSFPNVLRMTLTHSELRNTLGSKLFSGLRNVQTLDLSYSSLQVFPYAALRPLLNLTLLDLSHNKIETVYRKHFPCLPKLRTLRLSYNYISYIQPGIISRLQVLGLQTLDLSHNYITNVDPEIVSKESLSKLKYFDIRGNIINCSCSLNGNFGWLFRSKDSQAVAIPGFVPHCSQIMIDYFGGCLRCENSHLTAPVSLLSYSVGNLCEAEFSRNLCMIFTTTTVLFLVAGSLFHVKYFKRKLENYFLHERRLQYIREDANEFVDPTNHDQPLSYHGYVFFDKDDDSVGDWVDNILVPRMRDGSPSFNLSMAAKDDQCGTTQIKQVLMKMASSRKTIVVLTRKFSKTPRCRFVLSVLEDWFFASGEDRCVTIALDDFQPYDSSFRHRQKRNPDSSLHCCVTDDDPLFWEALRNALIIRSKL